MRSKICVKLSLKRKFRKAENFFKIKKKVKIIGGIKHVRKHSNAEKPKLRN